MTTALLVNGQTIDYDSFRVVQDGDNPATYIFYSNDIGMKAAHRALDVALVNQADPQSAPAGNPPIHLTGQ